MIWKLYENRYGIGMKVYENRYVIEICNKWKNINK